MNMKAKMRVLGLTLAIGCAAFATPSFAGWGQKDGKYYYVDDSTNKYIYSKWIHTSSGYYYIGSDGYMVTG